MKRITTLFIILVCCFALITPAFAGYSGLSEQELYGRTTPLTKFWVGQCVSRDGETIQQLSDGTWAMPGDGLYTCNKRGLANNWAQDQSLNPWLNTGYDTNFPYLPSESRNYPWGTNYPGGYANDNDWLTNCVILNSIVYRPECNSYPKVWSNGTPSYYDNYWGQNQGDNGFYGTSNGNGYYASFSLGDRPVTVAQTGVTNGTNMLQTFLLGYVLSRFIK